MKIKVIAASFLILCINLAINSQSKRNFYDKDPLEKNLGLADRAGGAHNINKIGLFFENRGKLYPRRITQGPSGEYPINSGRHYIYRLNPMVGIPGNVIQGRFTTNEEWEAVGGFHNPEKAKSLLATIQKVGILKMVGLLKMRMAIQFLYPIKIVIAFTTMPQTQEQN